MIGPRAAPQDVISGSTIKPVIAPASDQQIMAHPAIKPIHRRSAYQGISVMRPDQPLDTDIAIPPRISGVRRRRRERSHNTHRRIGIAGKINPTAAVQKIGPTAALQAVLARSPHQRVIAAKSLHEIGSAVAAQAIAMGRTLHSLDAGIAVTLRVTRVGQGLGKAGQNAARGIGIAGQIKPCAAIQQIRPAIALQRVIARPARQPIAGGIATQPVMIIRAAQILDLDIAVPPRLAKVAIRARQIGPNGRTCPGMADQVAPAAAIEKIRPAPAHQQIIADPAIQRVIPIAAKDLVMA